MRVGLFGGSFDPPHRAHLAAARAARERFELDRVLLAPAGVQPLKPEGAQASFQDRLRMVELLCEGSPGLEASVIDAPRADGRPNYTIDSVRKLRSEVPEASELFVIVGADAFVEIRRWKDPEDLLREARWIIVSRPGFDLTLLDSLGLTSEQRGQIEVLGDLAEPVSATEVRERLREHESASQLVPPRVLEYIQAHHLYGT
jgi:nicotinate-nucleotide adenylyltransferase